MRRLATKQKSKFQRHHQMEILFVFLYIMRQGEGILVGMKGNSLCGVHVLYPRFHLRFWCDMSVLSVACCKSYSFHYGVPTSFSHFSKIFTKSKFEHMEGDGDLSVVMILVFLEERFGWLHASFLK